MENIFVVHHGSQDYLNICLENALLHGGNVYLIGEDYPTIPRGVQVLDDGVDIEGVNRLKDSYLHMSSNSFNFEFQCLARYFLLLHYANELEIDSFWLFDSDLLLVSRLGEIANVLRAEECDAALVLSHAMHEHHLPASAHVSFWSKIGLESFVVFVEFVYQSQHFLNILRRKWDWHLATGERGGISDMALLYLWHQAGINTIFNLSKLSGLGRDSCFIDDNINSDEYFFGRLKMSFFPRIKSIQWIDSIPFVTCLSGRRIRVVCLHFQGGAKIYMKYFCSPVALIQTKLCMRKFGALMVRLSKKLCRVW